MEKNGTFWNAWADLFQFHKNHIREKSWDRIRDDSTVLEEKYQGTLASEFVNGMLVQVLLELERAGQQ